MFLVLFLSVLAILTCWRLSWPALWSTFGVTLDHRLTFDNHASAVARSCDYHARVIRHIRHLLTLDLAQTLACSLILSRIDYWQLCAARRSIQHHSEAPASPEQRGAYRSTSASTVRRQLVAPDAALAAC